MNIPDKLKTIIKKRTTSEAGKSFNVCWANLLVILVYT